jgi:hypothetical protein
MLPSGVNKISSPWDRAWRIASDHHQCWWLRPEHKVSASLLLVIAKLGCSWGHPTMHINTMITWTGSMLACCVAAKGEDAQFWEEQSG